MLPMNSSITLFSNENGLDDWGEPISNPNGETYEANVQYNNSLETLPVGEGKEIVYTANIHVKNYVPISYQDEIEVVRHDGTTIKKTPENISFIQDWANVVLFTKVVL